MHGSWTFLTNHAHVLLCLLQDPTLRIRDIARAVDITERAVQRIITDLDEAGYIERMRDGRNNIYKVFTDLPLRHPIERHRNIIDLVEMVFEETPHRRIL